MPIDSKSFMIFSHHSNPQCPERTTKPPFLHGVKNQKKNNIGAFIRNGYEHAIPF